MFTNQKFLENDQDGSSATSFCNLGYYTKIMAEYQYMKNFQNQTWLIRITNTSTFHYKKIRKRIGWQ